jgi:hypothetical protein
LVSHTKGKTKAEGIREKCAETDIGDYEEEVTEDWRKLHNREVKLHERQLCDFYFSLIVIYFD